MSAEDFHYPEDDDDRDRHHIPEYGPASDDVPMLLARVEGETLTYYESGECQVGAMTAWMTSDTTMEVRR